MKIVCIILIAIAAVVLAIFFFLYKMAIALYPFMHQKFYDLPPNEVQPTNSTAAPAKSSDSSEAPSLFEAIVEESHQKNG